MTSLGMSWVQQCTPDVNPDYLHESRLEPSLNWIYVIGHVSIPNPNSIDYPNLDMDPNKKALNQDKNQTQI